MFSLSANEARLLTRYETKRTSFAVG